ncbi:RNase A-like domain-containing protein [Streptomyces galilaeus]|uniref:RNase A-like domain-containing protein n=1 Tax=Streptomyces galilaeus TaxID=33899 RepID=UPI0038F6A5E3
MRDEATGAGKVDIPAASSFTDLDSAQYYTQHNVRTNTAEIDEWLKRVSHVASFASFL